MVIQLHDIFTTSSAKEEMLAPAVWQSTASQSTPEKFHRLDGRDIESNHVRADQPVKTLRAKGARAARSAQGRSDFRGGTVQMRRCVTIPDPCN
mgnify:CR=1 FL=1